jgi:hypothetical protein
VSEGPSSASAKLEYRRATGSDLAAGRDVVRISMEWRDGEPNDELFSWKHEQSPFGPSPSWVALLDGKVVGFRTFMRWRFLDDSGQPVTAVRAVDTATLPEARGLGAFRGLTTMAVAELTAEGVDLVFNTPNDQSRPGYLTMGWVPVGQLPLTMRPRSLAALPALMRARVPAQRWSRPTSVGVDAGEALSDQSVARAVLTHAPTTGYRTDRSPAYLAWRFGLVPLHYRLLQVSGDPAEGALVFRLRSRGPAVEAAVAEQLTPSDRVARLLVKRMLRETGADYAAGLHGGHPEGLVRVPRQGPLLTARRLNSDPPVLPGWSLTLGDIELF